MNNNIFTENLYGQSIEEMMNLIASLNIAVIKCIKDIFVRQYFIKCIGAFIFLGFFLCKIICIFTYLSYGLYDIRKFIFSLSNSYMNYISKKGMNINQNKINVLKINFPPKK